MPQFDTLTIILICIIAFTAYRLYEISNKIHCELIRADKTSTYAWASWSQQKVLLKTGTKSWGWFTVNTKKIIGENWKILGIFNTRGVKLIYSYESSEPLDPVTFATDYPDPDMRYLLDKKIDIQAMNETTSHTLSGGKQGLLQRYTPYIVVLGFVGLVYLYWDLQNRVNLLGVGQNYMEGLLQQILKK